jgi:selenide,water dikinase
VDDPGDFGAIAAANALSDVYAMGGTPLTALSIAAFPEHDFPLGLAAEIVRGGALKLAEAGCVLLGGHTVRDPEIKFGFAVTGLVHPERFLANSGARPGDRLVLTKPLGTGLTATALKAGRAPAALVQASTRSMLALNRAAAAAARAAGVRAATDVTGFGLAGHALGLARESGVRLELVLDRLPLLPGLAEVAGFEAGGLRANRRQYGPRIAGLGPAAGLPEAVLFDPQTSGGLLLCVPPSALAGLLASLPDAREIGRVTAPGTKPLALVDATALL